MKVVPHILRCRCSLQSLTKTKTDIQSKSHCPKTVAECLANKNYLQIINDTVEKFIFIPVEPPEPLNFDTF